MRSGIFRIGSVWLIRFCKVSRGLARLGFGVVGSGMDRCVMVGREGSFRQVTCPGFDPLCLARFTWFGMALLGCVECGTANLGLGYLAWSGRDTRAMVRSGMARRGPAWKGLHG